MAIDASKLFNTVIADVIDSAHESFQKLNNGEELLQRLKLLWESNLIKLRGVPDGASINDLNNEANGDTANMDLFPPYMEEDYNYPEQGDNGSGHEDKEPREAGNYGKDVEKEYNYTEQGEHGPGQEDKEPRASLKNGTIEKDKEPRVPLKYGTIEKDMEHRVPVTYGMIEKDTEHRVSVTYGMIREDYNDYVEQGNNGYGHGDKEPQTGAEGEADTSHAHRPVHRPDTVQSKNEEELLLEKELQPPLNDQDDLEEIDDILNADAKFETHNMVCAQFEKVLRKKSKWKCFLKDGIMDLHNQYYLFSQAYGEFDF